MALTNTEKQAAFRERQKQTMADLVETNKGLMAENALLREEAKKWESKFHALEVRTLKAELKAQTKSKSKA